MLQNYNKRQQVTDGSIYFASMAYGKIMLNLLMILEAHIYFKYFKRLDIMFLHYDTTKLLPKYSVHLPHFFKTQSNQIKLDLKLIIGDSYNIFSKLKEDPADFMIHVGILLKDLKYRLEYTNNGIKNSLIKSLISDVCQAVKSNYTIKLVERPSGP